MSWRRKVKATVEEHNFRTFSDVQECPGRASELLPQSFRGRGGALFSLVALTARRVVAEEGAREPLALRFRQEVTEPDKPDRQEDLC